MIGSRILCVDDEPNVLKSLRRLLRRDDHEVTICGSGAEALDQLEAVNPEVVISDQRMPGMTGTELLAEVKERRPDTIRVVLSGYADAGSILESINHGHIFRFLTKPWDDDQLRSAVQQCVQQYELGLQNRRLLAQIADQNEQLRLMNEQLEQAVEIRTRSLQFAQDILSRLPFPVIGIDETASVAYLNDAVQHDDTNLTSASIGASVVDVLPPAIASAVLHCLAGQREVCCLPVSEILPNRIATIRRLDADGELRGCLIAVGNG